LQALCNEALGDRANAVALMEKAVSLAASAGYCRMFLDEGRAIVDTLERARHVAPDFVNSLLVLLSNDGRQDSGPLALPEPLRKSELEILRLLKRGLTNQQIATELELSIATIKWHLGNIFGKLHVRNRTGAVTRARELKLL
jgi:LuxR family maltose regulon positive regulatory protein